MSQVQVKQLTYTYGDGIQALRSIDFHLRSGSKTALVGPNGAGKTSLLMALAGLIEFEGSIVIDDIRLSKNTIAHLRQKMSFVFQNPDEMLFMPTVLEDVCFGLDTLGLDEENARTRAREALTQVSLEGFEQRSAHHLSYGERRKVCLATSLARQSSLTLLDEPTRELDPRGRRIFINLFADMPGTRLLATHDLELILESCEQMILLDAGQIIIQGDPKKILANNRLMVQHGLEVPHSLTRHPHSH